MPKSRLRICWWFAVVSLLLFWSGAGIMPRVGALAPATATGDGAPTVYYQSTDPVGDDNGFGTYQYPTNLAFQPYHGLFDITGFKVWSEPGAPLYFDTSFGKITNPWMAPEGFIHQNLRIFVDSIPDRGMTTLPQSGAYVTFNPRYAWDFCLKIVGWGSSQLIKVEQGKLVTYPLKVNLLTDGVTIRADVPVELAGTPGPHWHYYVIAGSYDGFGEDFFRKVVKAPGEWVVGGGVAENLEPQVMDILAPEKGAHSQSAQLRSFDAQTGKLAELYPVGQDLAFSGMNRLILWIALLLMAVVLFLGLWLRQKPRKIAWFWIRIPKGEAGPAPPPAPKVR